jgi:hypothetical protein
MVALAERHEVSVGAPFYALAPRTVAIHRYYDPGFVALFQADVAALAPGDAHLLGWQQQDRMGSDQGHLLKLRRPVHRSFHVVAWEAACKVPGAVEGLPAIAPEKIVSAGFVLRAGDPLAPLGFQIVQGKAQGWASVDPTADPDAVRQVKALALLPRNTPSSPGYTGEETFPLHPLSVRSGGRPHTLLYGYLPIGGGDYLPPAASVATTGATTDDLPWPFGLLGRSNGPPPNYVFDQQIVAGQIQPSFAAVLRVLLGRYQLVDPAAWSVAANAPLIAALGNLTFYGDPPTPHSGQALRDWAAADAVSGVTLASVLRDWANGDGVTAAQTLLTSLLQAAPTASVPLPDAGGLSTTTRNLLVPEATATLLRDRLAARQTLAVTTLAGDMPMPKLISGPSGRYFVVPFVRTLCPNGCERINWGAPSEAFAVAAMFDPEASRPTLIEMPDLADAKKGLANGAAFNLPPALADLVNGLASPDAAQGVLKGSQPSGGLGIRFICSFSLPAISICAMIMLSITLSLLNIFLGWMAWVKICLPVPSKSSS